MYRANQLTLMLTLTQTVFHYFVKFKFPLLKKRDEEELLEILT